MLFVVSFCKEISNVLCCVSPSSYTFTQRLTCVLSFFVLITDHYFNFSRFCLPSILLAHDTLRARSERRSIGGGGVVFFSQFVQPFLLPLVVLGATPLFAFVLLIVYSTFECLSVRLALIGFVYIVCFCTALIFGWFTSLAGWLRLYSWFVLLFFYVASSRSCWFSSKQKMKTKLSRLYHQKSTFNGDPV